MDDDLCRFAVAGVSWITSGTDRHSVIEAMKALPCGAELLRVTAHRRVLRVGGRPALIVKHFSPRGIAANLKTFIRRSPALREWTALRKAARLALPVPRPVAVGWRHSALIRESFLVTEALDDSRSLASCLFGKQRLSIVARRQLTREAALVIRRMHDAGIFHKDLHLDNLIVHTGSTSGAVCLIDFQRVAFYRSLSLKARILNLATLNGGCMEATRTDRLRFLRAYLIRGSAIAEDWRRLATLLTEMGKRHRRRVWRSRERRCFAENREFKKIRLRNFTGIVRRDRAELIAAGWQEPAHCFSQATMVTRLGGRTLGRIDRANEALYIARYSDGGFLPAIKSFCASSGARRAWLTGNSCIMRGVGAATPLAWLQRRRWGWPVESYVIAEGEKGLDWVETLARYARDIRGKRRLITDFARYLAGMHDRDAAFRQLTGKDVIVVDKKPAFAFSIVDFGDVTIGSLPRRARIEQLYALARAGRESGVISKTDRLRFLRAYLGSDFHKEWKILGRGFRE